MILAALVPPYCIYVLREKILCWKITNDRSAKNKEEIPSNHNDFSGTGPHMVCEKDLVSAELPK